VLTQGHNFCQFLDFYCCSLTCIDCEQDVGKIVDPSSYDATDNSAINSAASTLESGPECNSYSYHSEESWVARHDIHAVAAAGANHNSHSMRGSMEGLLSCESDQETAGVGIFLRQEPIKNGGCVYVESVREKCSADRSGSIQIHDVIVEVNGVHVQGLPMSTLRDLITGKQGTYVVIMFRRMTNTSGPFHFSVKLMRGTAEYSESAVKTKSNIKLAVRALDHGIEIEREQEPNAANDEVCMYLLTCFFTPKPTHTHQHTPILKHTHIHTHTHAHTRTRLRTHAHKRTHVCLCVRSRSLSRQRTHCRIATAQRISHCLRYFTKLYIYIYLYASIHASLCIRVNTRAHTHTCTHSHTQPHRDVQRQTETHSDTCTYSYIYTRARTHTRVTTHTHTHTPTRTPKHTHAHTHARCHTVT